MNVGAAAQLACLLEASAPKPGNVSPGHDFSDAAYEDYLASAVAIGAPMAAAAQRTLGLTIRASVEATAAVVPSNTNLGIVLLFAPVAAAVVPERRAIQAVLAATTVEDARHAFAAIRLARPGGLGRVEAQDVHAEPDVTLIEAMRLAAARDDVAYEYSSGYEITFTTALPALRQARADGLSWRDAVLELYLSLLASRPDTHVARRADAARAETIRRQAQTVVLAGGVRTAAGRTALHALDGALRDPRNIGNPGTTADLTAVALFVALLGGAWEARHGGSINAPR